MCCLMTLAALFPGPSLSEQNQLFDENSIPWLTNSLSLSCLFHMMPCSAEEYRLAVDAHGKGQKFILRYHSPTRNGDLQNIHDPVKSVIKIL